MMRRFLLSLMRDAHAAAAAEMALILPMVFALLFTMMEGGYYFMTEHKAVKYVREGARYASRMNFDNFDCSGAGALTSTAVEDQIRNVTLTGQVSGGSARIEGWAATDINVSVACDAAYGTGLYAGLDDMKAPVVTVWTRANYTPILGLLGFDITNIDVVAQAEAAVGGL
jgi:Flp pilus assembly protein TadG